MSLGTLICGRGGLSCVATSTLEHLKGSIDRFAERAVNILNSEFSEEAQSFGAFCARVVLENSCAALVGRLDPFRLIYLAEFQAQPNFEHGRPTNSGFRWKGDVIPDDKVPQEMWGAAHKTDGVSRALFSAYADHVYWRGAHEAALDFLASFDMAAFEDLTRVDPSNYVNSTKGRCASLYSTLSKGVHWDFFVSSVVIDEGTLKESIRESLIILAGMGFISHFIPTSYRLLDHDGAHQTYLQFRGSFQ